MNDKAPPPELGEEIIDVIDLDDPAAMEAATEAALSDTPRNLTRERSREVSRPLDEIYQGLSPHQKAALGLDLTENPAFRETLPGQEKIVTLKFRQEDADEVFTFLKRASIIAPELQTTRFFGNGNETHVSITLVIHDPQNAITLAKAAKQSGLNLEITRIDTKFVPTLRSGSNIIAFHPTLQTDQDPIGNEVRLRHVQPEEDEQEEPIPFPTRRSLVEAEKQELSNVPKERPCNYLVIDIRSVSDLETIKKIKGALSSTGSKHIQLLQYNGHLVIINTSERAGTSIRTLARTIAESTDRKAIQHYGRGEIKRSPNGIHIEGFPSRARLTEVASHARTRQTTGLNIFLTNEFATKANIGRDGTRTTIETVETDLEGISKITEINDKISLNDEGGPDRIIGRDKERLQLDRFTDPTEPSPRLIIVEGEVGVGKSCIVEDARLKRESISTTLNPEKENSPYAQIQAIAVDIAKALTNLHGEIQKEIAENPTAPLQWIFNQLNPLIEYLQNPTTPSNEQEANALVEITLSALIAYETRNYPETRPFLLIIDDYHHSDAESDYPITQLIERFLASTKSKVLISTRIEPQERKPTQQRYLEEQAKRKFGIGRVKISPTDFERDLNENQEDETASLVYQFILYSLPAKQRLVAGTLQPKRLGHGVRQLAEISDSPLELVNYLIDLKENVQENFIITADTIDIKQSAIDELIAKGGGRDIKVYNSKTVLEKLTDEERLFMACISMVGSQASVQTLQTIARDILGIDTMTLLESLREKRFLKPTDLDENGQVSHLKIRHNTLRQAVLQTFDDKEKIRLALQLFNKLSSREDIPDEIKFSLLQYAAPVAPSRNTKFWREYTTYASRTLAVAAKNHQNGKTHQLAKQILGDLDSPEGEIGMTLVALKSSMDIPTTRKTLVPLIIQALNAQAESALQTGRFEDVYKTIDALETIFRYRHAEPEIDIDLEKLYMIGFEAAYVQKNPEKLQKYQRVEFSPAKRFIQEIKTKYREAEKVPPDQQLERLNEVIRYFEENREERLRGASFQDQNNVIRLVERLQTQAAIIERNHRLQLDEDVELQPYGFTPEQMGQFRTTQRSLDELKDLLRQYPNLLSSIDKLQLAEQQGELHSLQAKPEAIDFFTEGLRVARKMENHPLALRLIKRIGDLQVIQAIATREDDGPRPSLKRSGTIDPEWLEKAIDTYSQGLALLKTAKIDESSPHHLFIRVQIIRAISKLCKKHSIELDTLTQSPSDKARHAQIRDDMTEHLKTAFEELKYLSASETWSPALQDPEVTYYLVSSIGHILHFCKKVPQTSQETTGYGFMNKETIQGGLQRAYAFDTDNLEEQRDKLQGLRHAKSYTETEAV